MLLYFSQEEKEKNEGGRRQGQGKKSSATTFFCNLLAVLSQIGIPKRMKLLHAASCRVILLCNLNQTQANLRHCEFIHSCALNVLTLRMKRAAEEKERQREAIETRPQSPPLILKGRKE